MKPKPRTAIGGDALSKSTKSGASNASMGGISKADLHMLNVNGALLGASGNASTISGSSGGGGNVGGASGSGGSATTAASIRKRRSSINVYDQPSSLNSRLRQLETDMLRLDEDRTKLYDDTHSALASFELRVSEIHSILKSRQDNAEKSVEDMKLLLAAKDEFERQSRQLNEKHERMHDKFMHRETIVARELKLLKNKFELLEKSRQFRAILQKSNAISDTSTSQHLDADTSGGGVVGASNSAADGSELGSRRNSLLSSNGELDTDAKHRSTENVKSTASMLKSQATSRLTSAIRSIPQFLFTSCSKRQQSRVSLDQAMNSSRKQRRTSKVAPVTTIVSQPSPPLPKLEQQIEATSVQQNDGNKVTATTTTSIMPVISNENKQYDTATVEASNIS